MRRICFPAVLVGFVLIAFGGNDRSRGQQPVPEAGHDEAAKTRIVPVVMLKPGEQKELFMSTTCTVSVTRGGGLDIQEIGGMGHPVIRKHKIWEEDGLIVKVPDFAEASKEAAAPQYKALGERGLSLFRVKIEATKDIKPALHEFHLADITCNGTCQTDFRVLIVAP
jgi:hypothetical protein